MELNLNRLDYLHTILCLVLIEVSVGMLIEMILKRSKLRRLGEGKEVFDRADIRKEWERNNWELIAIEKSIAIN
jgi:hypothetical protein